MGQDADKVITALLLDLQPLDLILETFQLSFKTSAGLTRGAASLRSIKRRRV
jgi:hypothetical protein